MLTFVNVFGYEPRAILERGRMVATSINNGIQVREYKSYILRTDSFYELKK